MALFQRATDTCCVFAPHKQIDVDGVSLVPVQADSNASYDGVRNFALE
jgi:hypothetical protein